MASVFKRKREKTNTLASWYIAYASPEIDTHRFRRLVGTFASQNRPRPHTSAQNAAESITRMFPRSG